MTAKAPIVLAGKLDPKVYSERVSRSECFLGRDLDEMKHSQALLSKSVVGIAGSGGIGGAMALRLARLGVRHIKLADPQNFDWTNVNRQLGASTENIGRNKALAAAEIVHGLAGDVTVEVFEEGITVDNAEQFVSGCDLILDQLEFFVIREKFALHQAFRRHPEVKCILACSVIGWSAHLYRFNHDSMPIEKWYNIEGANNLTPDVVDRLIALWAPRHPHFPSYDEIRRWMAQYNAAPIFAGAPPLAEGILSQRAALVLAGLERPPFCAPLPPIPAMYCYDAATFEGVWVTADGRSHHPAGYSLERSVA